MKNRLILALMALLFLGCTSAAMAQNNACDQPGEAPDVIVGDLTDIIRYGTAGGYTGFSVGTESCNLGTCWANWFGGGSSEHPVIAQHLFRLENGRFEQIGQSWLKHGFATFDDPLCETPGNDCIPAGGQHLGVNCSDPYFASLNGNQSNLGPKSDINLVTGGHAHPFTDQGQTSSDPTYKRLRVRNDDLNPALHPTADYFVEGQYVTLDETAAGNNFNNNSYRPVNVSPSGGSFAINFSGSIQQEFAAIWAWRFADAAVFLKSINNQYWGGSRATALGGGVYHYELALQNLISHDAAQAISVPIPHGATVTNVGFSDVEYHSGEIYDGTDWSFTIDTTSDPNRIIWSTQTFAENPNANALRWGTLYNFWFDIDAPPKATNGEITAFLPGGPSLAWGMLGPDRCGDATCDPDENDLACPVDCAFLGTSGSVPDGDDVPGTQLTVDLDLSGDLVLDWDLSCVAGDSDYEVYEGQIGNFSSHSPKLCSTSGLTTATVTPNAGNRYYLVVPNNGSREGSYGETSGGIERGQGMGACLSQSLGGCP